VKFFLHILGKKKSNNTRVIFNDSSYQDRCGLFVVSR